MLDARSDMKWCSWSFVVFILFAGKTSPEPELPSSTSFPTASAPLKTNQFDPKPGPSQRPGSSEFHLQLGFLSWVFKFDAIQLKGVLKNEEIWITALSKQENGLKRKRYLASAYKQVLKSPTEGAMYFLNSESRFAMAQQLGSFIIASVFRTCLSVSRKQSEAESGFSIQTMSAKVAALRSYHTIFACHIFWYFSWLLLFTNPRLSLNYKLFSLGVTGVVVFAKKREKKIPGLIWPPFILQSLYHTKLFCITNS